MTNPIRNHKEPCEHPKVTEIPDRSVKIGAYRWKKYWHCSRDDCPGGALVATENLYYVESWERADSLPDFGAFTVYEAVLVPLDAALGLGADDGQ